MTMQKMINYYTECWRISSSATEICLWKFRYLILLLHLKAFKCV